MESIRECIYCIARDKCNRYVNYNSEYCKVLRQKEENNRKENQNETNIKRATNKLII